MSTAPKHRWNVFLEGDIFDLEDLPRWLVGFDPTVERFGDEYALVGPKLDALDAAGEVRRAATEAVNLINGLGRLLWSEFQPISVGRIVQFEPDGKRNTFVHLQAATIKARSKLHAVVISAGGTQPHAPKTGALAELIDRLQANTRAQRLVEILSHAELTWSDLYKAVEVVQEAVGSLIHEQGWASKKEIKLLKRTAQCYDLLGREARHAKSIPPPRKPMSFGQAKALVLRVAERWLRSLPSSA